MLSCGSLDLLGEGSHQSHYRGSEGVEGLSWGKENKERDILIEGAIMGLAKSLALGKFPGIHKDDPS